MWFTWKHFSFFQGYENIMDNVNYLLPVVIIDITCDGPIWSSLQFHFYLLFSERKDNFSCISHISWFLKFLHSYQALSPLEFSLSLEISMRLLLDWQNFFLEYEFIYTEHLYRKKLFLEVFVLDRIFNKLSSRILKDKDIFRNYPKWQSQLEALLSDNLWLFSFLIQQPFSQDDCPSHTR